MCAISLGFIHSAWAACTDCHNSSATQPVHAILNSAHARIGGQGDTQCVACHGQSAEHSADPLSNAPSISFGPKWPSAEVDADTACLSCHKNDKPVFWAGSVHQQESLGCTSCHAVHVQRDPIMSRDGQLDTCFSCHNTQRSQAQLPSHHPMLEGKTLCSNCHNPHGGSGEFMLSHMSVNDTCTTCHAEKRGPFLFDHPPAAENCSECHNPHGSIHKPLLVARGPQLCQQCHMVAFHPSQLASGAGLEVANPNMLAKNCLNCHSQVHGSNHPSGAKLTR